VKAVPTTGIVDRCARAARGHAAAPPLAFRHAERVYIVYIMSKGRIVHLVARSDPETKPPLSGI
jgi:hypothetical protein